MTTHGRRCHRHRLAAVCLALSWTLPGHAAPDMARAEGIVQGRCFICHGADGGSSSPVFPRLAGQNASYVARQLGDYSSGKRRSSTMQPMVDGQGPEDSVAACVSGLK